VTTALANTPYAKPLTVAGCFEGVRLTQPSMVFCETLANDIITSPCAFPCSCTPYLQDPLLSNELGHLVLRDCDQWETLFGSEASILLAENARNTLFPTRDMLQDQVEKFSTQLQASVVTDTFTNYQTSSLPHTQSSLGVMSNTQTGILGHALENACWDDVIESSSSVPWLDAAVVTAVKQKARLLGLRLGVWDKHLFRCAGYCRVLEEVRMVKELLHGEKLEVWGWRTSSRDAQAIAFDEVLHSAINANIVSDALGFKLISKQFSNMHNLHTWLKTCSKNNRFSYSPPSLFTLNKWKTKEREGIHGETLYLLKDSSSKGMPR
jgi:hypothetical protein